MDEFEEKIRRINAEHRKNKIIGFTLMGLNAAVLLVILLNWILNRNDFKIGLAALAAAAVLATVSFIRMRTAKKRLDETIRRLGYGDGF